MQYNQSSALLLAILAIAGMILVFADAALFIRWVSYLWAKYNLEDRRLREAAATEGTVPPDFALDLSQDPEMPVYPFARTWSLVDPFVAFQVVFIGGQFLFDAKRPGDQRRRFQIGLHSAGNQTRGRGHRSSG